MGTFQNRYNPRSAVEAALNAVRGLGDNSNYSEGGANGADMLSPAPSAVQPEANVAVEPNEAVAPVGPAVSWPSDMARAEAKRAGMTWEQAPGTSGDTPNPYLADWGHYSLGDVVYGRRGEDGAMDESMRRADVPVHQLLSDYANYEQSQGRTPDYVSMMQVLQAGDPRLSSTEQQKEEKRQRRRERWEQLTNLLSTWVTSMARRKVRLPPRWRVAQRCHSVSNVCAMSPVSSASSCRTNISRRMPAALRSSVPPILPKPASKTVSSCGSGASSKKRGWPANKRWTVPSWTGRSNMMKVA